MHTRYSALKNNTTVDCINFAFRASIFSRHINHEHKNLCCHFFTTPSSNKKVEINKNAKNAKLCQNNDEIVT